MYFWARVLAIVLSVMTVIGTTMEARAQEVPASTWAEAEKLIGEQKHQAALEKIDAILKKAKAEKQERLWTEAQIRSTQLRMSLHGYETSVRELRDGEWPKESEGRLLISLFYTHALMQYQNMYSWEIGQREKTVSSEKVDLKAWTSQQIGEEISRSFDEIMKLEEILARPAPDFFKTYVSENNYPMGIKPVFRDVVVEMATRHLANSQYWTPRESREVYKNDFGALSRKPPTKRIAASDLTRHPIEKIASWLGEHREFHLRAKREEAALNALYMLYEKLFQASNEAGDREVLRKNLKSLQGSNRGLSWWSRGQALLSDQIASGDSPSRLIEARAEALAGLKAFPESIGGKMCASIVQRIEAPSYSVLSMSTDSAAKRSILVNYKNLTRLYLRAYKMDVESALKQTKANGDLLSIQDMRKSILDGALKPAAEWNVELKTTSDYLEHRKFIVPGIKDVGAYVILTSTKPDFSGSADQVLAFRFVLSDLVITRQNLPNETLEVRVLSGERGTPIANAEIDVYRYNWNDRAEKVSTVKSDAKGLAIVSKPPQNSNQYWNYVLVAKKAGSYGFDFQGLYFSREGTPSSSSRSLVFTDRSIFRPGQRLLWKVAAYTGTQAKGEFKTADAGGSLTVILRDPNYQEVAKKTVTTGSFGTASGEFVIPAGRPLGQWQVQVTGLYPGGAVVRIEEYKRPTFESSLNDAVQPMRLNRKAKVSGSSKYYFGQPVSSGAVSWRVTREEILPRWWSWYSWFSPRPRQSETVASGSTKLKADGTFDIEFLPQVDERKNKNVGKRSGSTYNFTVDVDVTDEGGETRSASRSYRMGFVSVETDLGFEKTHFESGAPFKISASRRSLDGKAREGKAKYRIVRLKQPTSAVVPSELPRLIGPDEDDGEAAFRSPDDLKRARWETQQDWASISEGWSDGEEVASGALNHDKGGMATVEVKPIATAGVYRIHYETQDDFGAIFRTSQPFLVSGEKSKISVPLIFLSQSNSVEVGAKAKFYLHSGLSDQSLEIETYRRGRRIGKRTWVSGKDPSYFEIPVTKDDRGGFTVAVTGLRDHQLLRTEQTISVPWTDRVLALEFSSFRDLLRPGAKETFRVTVRDAYKKPVAKGAAEVLAYMYDRSLDLFGSHSYPSVLSSYGSGYGAVGLNVSLEQTSGQHWLGSFPSLQWPPSLYDSALKFHSSYGIGGPGRRYRGVGGGRGAMRSMVADEADEMSAAAPAPSMMALGEAAKEKKMESSESAPQARNAARPEPSSGGAKAEPAAEEIRSNFSETAFFSPHLITGADGSVSFEFTVPDSVTSWNVFAHALTKDWRGGSISKETKSVKELMVRPYAPRFLREGDEAEIKVVVNNASSGSMSGDVLFDIEDPGSGKSVAALFGLKASDLKKSFKAEKDGSATVSFSVKAPREVGTYAFKVTGKSKNFSDGERRPFPVLPSRMHLAQSRFVTLKNKDRKVLEFQDLAKNDDPTLLNEKMVVTVDAQLFYGVLKALPYLVNYPYECIEQTLNRFLATGIVSSVFDKYPSVAAMAKKMSVRDTKLERFDQDDANRRMTLEESPWLQQAQGGKSDDAELAKILDSRVAKAEREKALTRIKKMQLSSGAFPWFEGGPPDEFMTLYVLMGFGRAMEFKVDVPKDVTTKAWRFTRSWLDSEIDRMMSHDCCWEFITTVNYAASLYPDTSYTGGVFDSAYRKRLADYSFKHWKNHSPLLKGYLALTLHRLNRTADAKLVWDSVMDSSKSDDQLGTYWAAEDRSWLWYRDTIETHAFSLRALMELDPKDKRTDGLVQWLFLNKKMNHWKSTRATSEAIYSLAHYLESTKTLGVKEEVAVDAGTVKTKFVFEPNEYTGAKNQVVIDGEKMNAKQSSKIVVEKSTPGFAFASATWHFSTDRLPAEDRGDFFNVSRRYFKREMVKGAGGSSEWILKPLADGQKIAIGDQIEVQISLRTKHEAEYVHLRDPRAAGLEPENVVSGYKWDLGIYWFEEIRDSGANFFFSKLPVGEYTFKYRLRANMAGTFRVGPATVQSMYAPEFNAYSAGAIMKVEAK